MIVADPFTRLSGAEILEAFNADMIKSGLDPRRAFEELRFNPGTNMEMLSWGSMQHRGGFAIPYFPISGVPDDFDIHVAQGFRRFRYLEQSLELVVSQTKGRPSKKPVKPGKYAQTAGTKPELYFPHWKDIDWQMVADNTDIPIVITEGEKKSACLSLHGIPTIGLGGVYNFLADGSLLPAFSVVKWSGRHVVVVFDSNGIKGQAQFNAQVLQASDRLCAILSGLGAQIHQAFVPHIDGHSTGIDDYVVAHGVDSLRENVLDRATQVRTRSFYFAMLDKTIAYIRSNAVILDIDPASPGYLSMMKKPLSFRKETDICKYKYREAALSPDGKVKDTEKVAFDEWWSDPTHRVWDSMVLRPGQGFEINNSVNMWRGWGVIPIEGDTSLWDDMLYRLFRDAVCQMQDGNHAGETVSLIEVFTELMFFPLAHPGAKMRMAPLIYGSSSSGKSRIGDMFVKIYGHHARALSAVKLDGHFNGQLENMLFVKSDELLTDYAGRSDFENWFKMALDPGKWFIERKGLDGYDVENLCNFYFTSNKDKPISVGEGTDRRLLVFHDTQFHPREELWEHVQHLLFGEGTSHLLHRAMNHQFKYITESHQAAPATEFVKILRSISRSDLDVFMDELAQEGGVAKMGLSLASVQEIVDRISPGAKYPPSANTIVAKLRARGFVPLKDDGRGGAAVVRFGETTAKVWIIEPSQREEIQRSSSDQNTLRYMTERPNLMLNKKFTRNMSDTNKGIVQ